ncbi:MAG: efflux RND transporter permease subunit, partial [Chitinophagaceae bacterium]|nr:efflux RND transporter permease subunit [Chitinophagaceae bacterium]
GFNVRGRDVQSIVNELSKKSEQQLHFSPGYYITYGGAFENLNQAKDRLMIAVPISLALIFLLLFFAFHSIKESLLIYTAIPLSAIGGIFLLALRGMPFSISAGIGFIALFGVAVLNGIVLIAEFNRLKKSGEQDLEKVVLNGTKTRLRPVLMTAFVASLGFLPMALSKGAGAEVQKPLATVVIGGLLIATFLTLFVLPTLFIQFEKIGLKKMKLSKKSIATLIVLLFQISLFAQNISLEQALEMADKNNLSIKSNELLENYQSKKKASYLNIPQTNFSAELGQINTPAFDNKFGLTQNINFPTVYSNQKKVLEQEWQKAITQTKLSKIEIRKLVTQIFYQILLLKEQKNILSRTDTLYAEFLEKSRLRFEKGAGNILEKTTAEIQFENISNQLKWLENEIDLAKIQLQWLLNSDISYEAIADNFIIDLGLLTNETSMDHHPLVELSQQEIEQSKLQVKLEKSKLLPDLSLSYYNQSFTEFGQNRYSVVALGVGIPIFASGQKANIKAEQQKIAFYENEQLVKKAQLETEYRSALSLYQTQKAIVENFQNKQLPQAEQIFKTAKEQFANGDINYLDWVLLNDQATQIQTNYYQAVAQLNQTAIIILYLISK